MFKLFYLTFILLFFLNDGKLKLFQGTFESAKSYAASENKLILLLFYEDEESDAYNVLTNNQEFVSLSDGFVNYLVKHDSKDWNLLTKIYNIDSSKALVLCKPDGEEIDRIYSGSEFKNISVLLKNYLKNEKTLDDYLGKLSGAQDNVELLLIIGSKYLDRGKKDLALNYYSKAWNGSAGKKPVIPDYPLHLLALKRLSENSTDIATAFLKLYPASRYTNIVFLSLADFHIRSENYKQAREVYDSYLQKFPNDPSSLNNFAYLSSMLNIDLKRALNAVDKALVISKDNYSKIVYLDTKAEVLYKMKKYNEAIETAELAIQLAGNDYAELKSNLVEQINKFRKSMK